MIARVAGKDACLLRQIEAYSAVERPLRVLGGGGVVALSSNEEDILAQMSELEGVVVMIRLQSRGIIADADGGVRARRAAPGNKSAGGRDLH